MPTTKKSKLTASDFIRTQPRNITATKVVEAGNKEGLSFSANLVYAVRGAKKKKGKGGAAASTQAAGGAEPAFRGLVLKLGLTRSRALLADVELGIARVIRGG